MNIHESAEDYLEAILKLKENQGMVRSIDIVRELGFSKPSISVAMKNLRENGYIRMDDDGYITLLPPGEEIAQRIYSRHKLLTQIFIQLGVSQETAMTDACKVEHDLSDETFEKIKAHAAGENGGMRCDQCPLKAASSLCDQSSL
ncbi:MAG: metal-dependent transcriptional regulator [Angelakisella sp.]|nr:metal-dependent transcriptional regulator [Angelakisella sp.]